jgi:hypothetical protein
MLEECEGTERRHRCRKKETAIDIVGCQSLIQMFDVCQQKSPRFINQDYQDGDLEEALRHKR